MSITFPCKFVSFYRTHPNLPGANVIARLSPSTKFHSIDGFFNYANQNQGKNIVILFRHGSVDLSNGEGACFGKFYGENVVLNYGGETQIKNLGELFKGRIVIPHSTLFTSPLQRTVESGNLFVEASGLKMDETKKLEELKEIDIGRFLNSTLNFIKKPLKASITALELTSLVLRWIDNPEKISFPEGESIPNIWTRISFAAGEISEASGKGIVYVSGHEITNRLLVAKLLGLDLSTCRKSPPLNPGGFIAINAETKEILYAHNIKGL